MESDSRFKQWVTKFSDWLNEQVWFQQIKSKWDELDPNSRTYLRLGAMGASVLIVLIGVISMIWSVHSLKSELHDKQELLSTIQTANDELRRLRDQTSSVPQSSGGGTWPAYFETVATNAGIEKDKVTIGSEKPGAAGETTKESLYDLNLKHVNIKQVVRYAFGLENGNRPVKLRHLQINTQSDPEGYLDATLSVSGFALVTK